MELYSWVNFYKLLRESTIHGWQAAAFAKGLSISREYLLC